MQATLADRRSPPPPPSFAAATRRPPAAMFSLLSGCFEYMLRKEELHVLIVGLDKAGKTTLLERLKSLYTDVAGAWWCRRVPLPPPHTHHHHHPTPLLSCTCLHRWCCICALPGKGGTGASVHLAATLPPPPPPPPQA